MFGQIKIADIDNAFFRDKVTINPQPLLARGGYFNLPTTGADT